MGLGMKILVAGAGAVGRAVARRLVDEGNDVTLMDNSPDAIKIARVPRADWALADACSPEDLEATGARDADAFVVVTGDDKVNLVASLLAKTLFAVPKVIARANTAANEWMYTEDWGVDVLASTPQAITSLVTEAVAVGDAIRLLSLNEKSVSVYSLELSRGSPQIAHPARSVPMPEGLILGAVIRGGEPRPPEDIDQLEPGDQLVIIKGRDAGDALAQLEQLAR